jgi:dihydropteroate synthase
VVELSQNVLLARQSQGAVLMGVLNVTPDSFYDGGRYADADAAESRVDSLLEEGAHILDLGGESSRPGSPSVSAEEQKERVARALTHAVARGAIVSIDTTHPDVADFALSAGARIVNDVSFLADPNLARVAARHDAVLILTHCRGPMSSMPGFSDWPDDDYADVVAEVITEWERARERACAQGLSRDAIWCDPGLGFSKNARHSFDVLRGLRRFEALGTPIVVGPGRKSFIASIDPSPPEERLGGTVAACLTAAQNGATVLRIHDVRPVRQALAVYRAAAPEAAHA